MRVDIGAEHTGPSKGRGRAKWIHDQRQEFFDGEDEGMQQQRNDRDQRHPGKSDSVSNAVERLP